MGVHIHHDKSRNVEKRGGTNGFLLQRKTSEEPLLSYCSASWGKYSSNASAATPCISESNTPPIRPTCRLLHTAVISSLDSTISIQSLQTLFNHIKAKGAISQHDVHNLVTQEISQLVQVSCACRTPSVCFTRCGWITPELLSH